MATTKRTAVAAAAQKTTTTEPNSNAEMAAAGQAPRVSPEAFLDVLESLANANLIDIDYIANEGRQDFADVARWYGCPVWAAEMALVEKPLVRLDPDHAREWLAWLDRRAATAEG